MGLVEDKESRPYCRAAKRFAKERIMALAVSYTFHSHGDSKVPAPYAWGVATLLSRCEAVCKGEANMALEVLFAFLSSGDSKVPAP